jgi:hypothetical protein
MRRFFLPLIICGLSALPVFAGEVMREYRGVKLGMARDEVRQKLGRPSNEAATEEGYALGGGNAMRVYYTPEKTVKTIVLYFYNEDDKVPKFADVVGEAEVEQGPGGSQRAKFIDQEADLSVTMFRNGGANPMTVITINRYR